MQSILNALSSGLYGGTAMMLLFSFLWGIASVLLSPCHLSGIPLVVAVLTGKRKLTLRQTLGLTLLFSLGVLASIAIIGGITALLGRILGDLGSHANLIFGIALILGGVLLLDVLKLGGLPLLSRLRIDGSNPWLVLAVGLLFGLALGPCAFAFMAPVLTLTFSLAASDTGLAMLIMLAYAVGHCLIIALAGTSLSMVQRLLNWISGLKGMLLFKRICALLVIAAGIYLIFK